jgi:hypothetical protein
VLQVFLFINLKQLKAFCHDQITVLFFIFSDIDDLISVTSVDSRRRGQTSGAEFHDNPEDDRESIQSGLATLPDSSYAGFERVQPPSSTPNRPAVRILNQFS